MTRKESEDAAMKTLLPSQFSVKLCMETLTALWGVKGMARLRYLIHMASFASTQEHHTVF
jgi:hypothetical protein